MKTLQQNVDTAVGADQYGHLSAESEGVGVSAGRKRSGGRLGQLRIDRSADELTGILKPYRVAGSQLFKAYVRAAGRVGIARRLAERELEDIRDIPGRAAQVVTMSGARALPWRRVVTRLGRGTYVDPSPGRLLEEWRYGTGSSHRDFDERSSFSKQFSRSPTVMSEVRRAIGLWKARNGVTGTSQDFYPTFSAEDFFSDYKARNGARHVIGSYRLTGRREGSTILWTASNAMGLKSFAAGRITDQMGVGHVPDRPRDPRRITPFGTTTQTIEWRTDLDGRPID